MAWQREQTITVERLERALVTLARVVVLQGPVYAPLMERIERELAAARRDDPVQRARRILAEVDAGRARLTSAA